MGINLASGKLGCPHLACCYTTEISIKQTEIITMQYIITDEEVKRFDDIYVKYDGRSDDECVKAALLDFLSNRPESTLGKLRPIAEMPETVPEGCVRKYCSGRTDKGEYVIRDTNEWHTRYFIDIQLPTPDLEAEERQRFEEATTEAGLCSDFRRDERGLYRVAETCVAWDAWKLAKTK